MLLSAISLQNPLSNPKLLSSPSPRLNLNLNATSPRPIAFTNANLRHITPTSTSDEAPEASMLSSASAVVSAIRRASKSPVNFIQRIEKDPKSRLVLPSPEFQRLCVEQLDLFRRIVDPDAMLSVYVRPAGGYVMDRLELRQVICYPGKNTSDVVILVGDFTVPAGLRITEAILSNNQVEFVTEHRALVFPMVKHPFVVGFLVAEIPRLELLGTSEDVPSEGHDLIPYPAPEEPYVQPRPPGSYYRPWAVENIKDDEAFRTYMFTDEQRLNAINISRTLAMAYVMDQTALLLQESSWQNNVRMSNLVEQIRGPLSSIQSLSKMLSVHTKRTEISHDIVEDILVQGDHIRDTLEQLQDAVYQTKTNIMRYNKKALKKMHNPSHVHPESLSSQLSNNIPMESPNSKIQKSGQQLSLNAAAKDSEMPMPPLALAPVQQNGTRSCDVSIVLEDLVGAVQPLALKQQRVVELSELSQSLQVAIEESALRQALSNLIEGALLRTNVGGRVEILSTRAPAGGALVVIDDDGPDMHYMTQMHSLTPFGPDLLSENMVEDNMTWNFVAGLTVAREILESYGCVVRVISPRSANAALGTGGTRIELWIPSLTSPNLSSPIHEA